VYGPTRTATATDATPATLPRTEFAVTPPSYQAGSFQVAVTLLWYSPSTGAIEGRRDYVIDYYNLAVTRPQYAPLREATVYGNCADRRSV
jgi:hypothetical protein